MTATSLDTKSLTLDLQISTTSDAFVFSKEKDNRNDFDLIL